jgi:hypothetical protein
VFKSANGHKTFRHLAALVGVISESKFGYNFIPSSCRVELAIVG